MADDTTTTWLKKNNEVHPLKRSLKTSMRLKVNAEMDASIISNLHKPKDQQIFIPQRMRRPSTRLMELRSSGKLPGIATAKTSNIKASNLNNEGVKVKTKAVVSALPKKSFVPVRKNQPLSSGKKSDSTTSVKPSVLLSASIKKHEARKELIQKMVKLDEESQKMKFIENFEKNLSYLSSKNSVLRSILKKHRAFKIAHAKNPAKKVLFEDFLEKNSNGKILSLNDDKNNDFDAAPIDTPTMFPNLTFSHNFESTPHHKSKENQLIDDIKNMLKIFNSYQEKVKYLKSTENHLSVFLESIFQNSQALKDEFDSYKKMSEKMHRELLQLDEKLTNNLSIILSSMEAKNSPRI